MEVDRDVTWDRWQEEMAALICHRQRRGPGARARWIPLAQRQTSHKVNGHYGGEVKLLIRLHSTSKYSSDFSGVINCWTVLYNNICQGNIWEYLETSICSMTIFKPFSLSLYLSVAEQVESWNLFSGLDLSSSTNWNWRAVELVRWGDNLGFHCPDPGPGPGNVD